MAPAGPSLQGGSGVMTAHHQAHSRKRQARSRFRDHASAQGRGTSRRRQNAFVAVRACSIGAAVARSERARPGSRSAAGGFREYPCLEYSCQEYFWAKGVAEMFAALDLLCQSLRQLEAETKRKSRNERAFANSQASEEITLDSIEPSPGLQPRKH
jgi:hypothetical protein